MDNYAIQMESAKKLFLQYDQLEILRRFSLPADVNFLYPRMLGSLYRLDRGTGNLQRQENGIWTDANTFDEVMTLLDLLCRQEGARYLTGRWKSTQNFGHMFHRGLLENQADPLAARCARKPEAFREACLLLGGREIIGGDLAFAIPLFEELEIGLFFWQGDGEFPSALRYFWDENALAWLHYETMHYALGMLKTRLNGLLSRESVLQ